MSKLTGIATLWDIRTGKKLGEFKSNTGFVDSALIMIDEQYLAAAGSDNGSKLWAVESGRELKKFKPA